MSSKPRVVGTAGGGVTTVTGRHGFVEEEKTSLPDARVGDAYNAAIDVFSESEYEVHLASGKPAPGLTMDDRGVISGTPTAAGTYKFHVGVSNSKHKDFHHPDQTKEFTLVVKA